MITNGDNIFYSLYSRPHFYDGLKQHLIFMEDYVVHVKTNILDGNIPSMYRFKLGLGTDMILHYTYYSLFDPITIIAYILPTTLIEFSYFLMLVLRMYLSGIFFIVLAKKIGVTSKQSLVAGSIVYVFSSALLYSAFRHPMFINGFMLFPLLLFSVEKVIINKTYGLLIFVTFFAIISQFYISLYLLFGLEIYILYRINPLLKQNRRIFIKINLLIILGVGMASFVLLPMVFAVLEGSRTTTKGFVFYDLLDYIQVFSSYLFPLGFKRYNVTIGNSLVLFLSLVFVFSPSSKYRYLKNMVITFFILGLLSPFAFLINAFSYVGG
ncbi:MAG: YfhO family protein, partial [bacterium]